MTMTKPTYPVYGLHADLNPHQQDALAWLLDRPRALLAHEMGLGKTVTTLAYIAALEARGELAKTHAGRQSPCRVLWVTEASLLEQARRSVERFLPDYTVEVGAPSGVKAKRRWEDAYGAHGPDILIVSYEMASRRQDLQTTAAPALLVLDEVGKVRGGDGSNSSGAKQKGGALFRTVRGLAARSPRVVGLTASWLQNRPTDPYYILSAIGTPSLWPYPEFERRFCVLERTHTNQYTGKDEYAPLSWTHDNTAVAEVREYLAQFMHLVDVEDTGLTLPVQAGTQQRWVTLTGAERRAYDAASRYDGLDGYHKRERALVAAANASGGDSSLIAALMEELAKRPREQAIVYCGAKEMLSHVEKHLANGGITYGRLDGDVKVGRERDEVIDAFREGRLDILLGSKVLEHGLDLQHCRLLFSVDSAWNPEREKQREGRIRRIGSPHETYEHLSILPETSHHRRKVSKLDQKRELIARVAPPRRSFSAE